MKKRIIIAVLCIVVALTLSVGAVIIKRGYTIDYVITRLYAKIEARLSNRQVEIVNEPQRQVVNEWTKGYSVALPFDMKVDTSNYQEYITAKNDTLTVTVTREWAPYEDILWYIENYQNNYVLSDYYRQKNEITLIKNESLKHNNGASARLINVKRAGKGDKNQQNNYTYFYVLSDIAPQAFFRIMAKTSDYEKDGAKIDEIISSFKEIPIRGEVKKAQKHKRVKKDFSKETKELYDSIVNTKKIKWGIFVDGAYTDDDAKRNLFEIEEKTQSNFEFSLHYVNLDGNFPIKELEKMYEKGKITELTLQISHHYNSDLFGKNPNFDVYDGLSDDKIRSFAKGAKEFGKPFLFRLNNEMNSDWVNYSGVAALSDPEIFKSNWVRIYEIFKQEGVNNAIWIFNPNNEDCPPCHWNSYLAYYPGDEYVDMIGMTGYNTGTYYYEVFNETWRTFDEINKAQYEKLMERFSDFPFIITEFASSSVGGDKEKWIFDMFKSIKQYPNIKMALWWSSRDYDFRDESGTKIARPYFLDETEGTLNAFKEGMKEYMK
ncbi:MAG: hypothetical protein IJE46_01550 [Clostridia bacterium]|nr:hypothetical protein [Clostridia bacterium]